MIVLNLVNYDEIQPDISQYPFFSSWCKSHHHPSPSHSIPWKIIIKSWLSLFLSIFWLLNHRPFIDLIGWWGKTSAVTTITRWFGPAGVTQYQVSWDRHRDLRRWELQGEFVKRPQVWEVSVGQHTRFCWIYGGYRYDIVMYLYIFYL